MKGHRAKSDLERFVDDVSAKQRNIVWPGPLVNSRGVDSFFWNGSPNPTIIQRIAAWLFAATDIGGALMLALLAWRIGGTALVVLGGMAVLVFALGIRTFSNGFARSPRQRK
ncbi:MAG TPA: hypothetical protein VN519_01535 [Bryobacteraceae bacterium]|nr:hypothetical protein [Bryobacteraceae bacterium]